MAIRIVKIADKPALPGSVFYYEYSGTIIELLDLESPPWANVSRYKTVVCSDGTITVEVTDDDALINQAVRNNKAYPYNGYVSELLLETELFSKFPQSFLVAECFDDSVLISTGEGGADVKKL